MPPLRAAALLLLLSTAAAHAADTDTEIARSHFLTGLRYYDSARYEPAVREFLEAYRLAPKPDLLYNIARAYEKLADPGRATTYYRRYLAARPSTQERKTIETQLAIFAPSVATLTVDAPPPGSEILVDGEPGGTSPIEPLQLTAGPHRIESRPPHAAPIALELTLEGGESREVRLGEPVRPRWLVPAVAGAAAAVVVILVITIAVVLSPDYGAAARGRCSAPGCVLFDGAGFQ